MDELTKLRTLIWDKDSKVFTDSELQEFLADTVNLDGTNNVYRAAALCLDIVRGDPERKEKYSRGGVFVSMQNLDSAIKRYESMAGDRSIKTVSLKKVY